MLRALCSVALLSLACLLLRAARVGMAGDYVDPVSKITARGEALNANSAIHMATEGGWLTPMFMGRYALSKPLLPAWTAGLSARMAGISRLSLRFPIALVCSLAVGLIFLWVAELRSWQAGACAAVLLASNHLWHVLGSMCMADGLLAAFSIAAMYCLFADPWLESRAALWGFAMSVAAAVLTKSSAGMLLLGALGLYWLLAPRKHKPAFSRICLAAGLAALLASPWFIYEVMAHGRWFRAEHFALELLRDGAVTPPQAAQEHHLLFYAMRMALLDPVLTVAALVALPAFLGELRRRSAAAVLLLCWALVILGSVFGWQDRNVAYLLPLIPALAILAAAYGPFARMRPSWWGIALVGAALVLKMTAQEAPWGISFHRGTVQALAPVVSNYCEQGRGNELILATMEDDLYASLPLPRLRYSLEGSVGEGPDSMRFARLGIVITATRFDDLEKWMPVFRARLREWGLDSDEAIGTLIMAQSPEDYLAMVRAHPASDFLFPNRLLSAVEASRVATHVKVDSAPGYFMLLSRAGRPLAGPAGWSCRL